MNQHQRAMTEKWIQVCYGLTIEEFARQLEHGFLANHQPSAVDADAAESGIRAVSE